MVNDVFALYFTDLPVDLTLLLVKGEGLVDLLIGNRRIFFLDKLELRLWFWTLLLQKYVFVLKNVDLSFEIFDFHVVLLANFVQPE